MAHLFDFVRYFLERRRRLDYRANRGMNTVLERQRRVQRELFHPVVKRLQLFLRKGFGFHIKHVQELLEVRDQRLRLREALRDGFSGLTTVLGHLGVDAAELRV